MPASLNMIKINNITQKISRVLLALLLAFSLGACNESDDLQEIFVGHNWKLTFVKNGGEMYASDGKEYKIVFGESQFNLTTPAGATISGGWHASSSGDRRNFGCNNIKVSGNIANDKIAVAIKNILENATTYEGDAHYLKIVHTINEFVQFYNR